MFTAEIHCGSGLARESGGSGTAESRLNESIKQGISGRFDGLFFRLGESDGYISKTNNQMNKYDLWIYKSAVKVMPSKRDRTLRIANTVQGIF
ncbi:hypothetical protein [Pseudomonas fluorescens]|uniref:hypothetical protein n=1 Tax=Pseudomonas fluorescens TaxID=294 RepID=UPI00123FE9BF|nr:hypothetical protein [Pseudomonas fluorescens]